MAVARVVSPELLAKLEEFKAEAERDGYEQVPGFDGATMQVVCERHAVMYEGCDREEVIGTITQTFLTKLAEKSNDLAQKHGLNEPETFASLLQEFADRGQYMCCKFPDEMHARLAAKTKGN